MDITLKLFSIHILSRKIDAWGYITAGHAIKDGSVHAGKTMEKGFKKAGSGIESGSKKAGHSIKKFFTGDD